MRSNGSGPGVEPLSPTDKLSGARRSAPGSPSESAVDSTDLKPSDFEQLLRPAVRQPNAHDPGRAGGVGVESPGQHAQANPQKPATAGAPAATTEHVALAVKVSRIAEYLVRSARLMAFEGRTELVLELNAGDLDITSAKIQRRADGSFGVTFQASSENGLRGVAKQRPALVNAFRGHGLELGAVDVRLVPAAPNGVARSGLPTSTARKTGSERRRFQEPATRKAAVGTPGETKGQPQSDESRDV